VLLHENHALDVGAAVVALQGAGLGEGGFGAGVGAHYAGLGVGDFCELSFSPVIWKVSVKKHVR